LSDEKLLAVKGDDRTPFNAKERLVIELADAMVAAPANISDDLYARLLKDFSEEQLMELELRPEDVAGKTFYYGKGCDQCNSTGYKGRFGLYEIMMLDDDVRDMIIKHASTQVLRNEAKKRGMRTLRQSGLMAIYDGITSIEEVVRETIMEEG